jgi:ABC-type Co2+ transport system permease subunit
MDVLSFWIIGLLAIAASAISMTDSKIDPLMSGTFSLVMWVMFAFSAYSVEVSVGGGTSVTHSYPALALLGILAAVIMFLGLLQHAFNFDFIDEIREQRF